MASGSAAARAQSSSEVSSPDSDRLLMPGSLANSPEPDSLGLRHRNVPRTIHHPRPRKGKEASDHHDPAFQPEKRQGSPHRGAVQVDPNQGDGQP